MSLERTNRLLVGVLLAVALFSVSATVVSGAPAAERGQTADETTNATPTDSTANATVGNLTVWTAPGDDFANLTSPAAVEAATREGWLTRSRTVAEDDTVVFELPAPGLVEAVAAANGTDSDAAAFVRHLADSETDQLRVRQTPATSGTMVVEKVLNLSATLAADGLRVVPDTRNGTLYVALRTDRAVLGRDGSHRLSLQDAEDYRVNLTVTDGNTTTSSSVVWGIVERRLAFDTGGSKGWVVVRLGQPCTVVSGETAAAPGTDIELRLRSTETHRLQATARATVDSAGEFATCIDTTGIDRNATLALGAATFDSDYDHPVQHNSSAPPATPDGDPAVWIAPTERFGDITSPAAVQTARRSDWLTRTRTVAEGDTVVFGLPAPGLVEAVGAANGTDSDAAALVQVLNRSDTYDFRVAQTDDTTTTMAAPKELNLSATLAADGLRVVPDERNGMLYVALRTDRAVVDRGNGYPLAFEDGEDYRVNLTATADNTTTSSTAEWSVVVHSIDFDGEIEGEDPFDEPHLARFGQRCTVVSGETPLAPGTTIPLVLRSNESGPVRASARATVAPSGEFATCVDTTGIDRTATLVLGAAGFDDDYNVTVVDRQFDPAADAAGIRSVWIAPTERFGDLTSTAAVDDGKQYGWLTRNRTVAVNDTVVFAVHAPELTDRIELARGNDSATERFVELVNRSSVYHFGMEQTPDTSMASNRENVLNLSATLAADAIRAVPDDANGTLYVALRTDRIVLDHNTVGTGPVDHGEEYEVKFTIGSDRNSTSSVVEWSVVERAITFDDERSVGIVVDDLGEACTLLSGITTVAPGTPLRITLGSRDGAVRTTHGTTVGQSRQFSACAHTTGIPADAVLDLRADEIPHLRTVLVENRTGPLAVTIDDVDESSLSGYRTSRNSSGFVTLYAVPNSTDRGESTWLSCRDRRVDEILSNWTRFTVSDLLEPGQESIYLDIDDTDIESGPKLLVAVAHPDRDGDGEFDFLDGDDPACVQGSLVADVVTTPPPDAGGSENSSQTTEPSTSVTTDGSPTTAVTTTSNRDGPGFGPVAATLALLAVALLAHRRS
ncbi:PGF-CTERM sorting domain-containing protein [Halorientalis pallida]|uniref:PGF-CTERM sorting domain-containing protein n=1 Tax=Halorientalis pallida TaxID=2479928 RepID=UPI003C6EFA99